MNAKLPMHLFPIHCTGDKSRGVQSSTVYSLSPRYLISSLGLLSLQIKDTHLKRSAKYLSTLSTKSNNGNHQPASFLLYLKKTEEADTKQMQDFITVELIHLKVSYLMRRKSHFNIHLCTYNNVTMPCFCFLFSSYTFLIFFA